MTTYLKPPRTDAGRFADRPEIGLARRLTEQARMLLGYDEQDESTDDEREPLDIESMLAKQDGHPLNHGVVMETKGRTVGRIAGVVQNAIGFVSFDPSAHPRDYQGRFLNTGDDIDLPDGRRGVVETLNADGTMSVRADGGIVAASAPEVRRVDTGGIAVALHDGRAGTADRTGPTGDVVVRLPDNTEVTAKPADLTPAPEPVEPGAVQFGIDGKPLPGQIVQGAGVRDAAGHIGVATTVEAHQITVDFGGDTRTMRPDALTPTAGTADSDFPSPLDERLVNSKPSRNLSDPTKTVPLSEMLPGVRYQAYSQVPFLAAMHERMDVTDPLTVDVGDYIERRDALFVAQPLTSVPLDHVVVTQKSVNRDRVTQIAMDPSTGGTKPVHFVRFNGETYVMNGHHRIAAQIINGDSHAIGRVLDLDKARADDPTMDPFDAAGPDAAGLPTGIGRGAVVLTGAGHLAFITDASDAARMRAWDDDTRAWVSLTVGDVGSVRVPNTDPDTAQTETLMRSRVKEAGLDRVPKPAPTGLPLDQPRPHGALAPVDGIAGIASLGDGAVPRAAFESLLFNDTAPEPLDPNSTVPPEVQRAAAASRRRNDAVVDSLTDLPDDLMADITGIPLDATYALTSIGGVIKTSSVTDHHRDYLSRQQGMTMDVPGTDPRIAASRRAALASQYANMWQQTSGDSVPRANALQESARDLFGIEGASTNLNETQDEHVRDILAREGPAMRAYLAATYAATQEYLTRNGVDSIVAYRGSSFRADGEPEWTHHPQTDAPLRPLTSWSADPTHAIKFSDNKDVGVVRVATIPRDRILSIPVTGPGVYDEAELVVLGGPGISTVVNPVDQPVVAQGGLDETPASPTWVSPGKPIADMPTRDDLQTPDDRGGGFAWRQWADFYVGGLDSEDYSDPNRLSPIKGTTPGIITGENAVAAKKSVVADLVGQMELVPDEVMFRGVDDGFGSGGFTGDVGIEPVTHAAISRGQHPRITPHRPGEMSAGLPRIYEPEMFEIVPITDPRVREYRRGLVINSMVGAWATSSNDGSPVAHAIQEITQEHFGLADTAGWDMDTAALQSIGGTDLRGDIDKVKEDRGEAIAAFLQAQYDLTQRRFADAGITEVDVYRGMGWAGTNRGNNEVAPDWAQVDGEAQVALRPLSSWSVDRDTADQFGRNSGNGNLDHIDAVLGTTVPVERIIATPRTGVGCLNEWEIVVLGGRLDVTVRTSVIPPLTEAEANATPAGTLDNEADFQTAVRMATTEERRKQLMSRARDRGGFWGMIPVDWYPDTGLSEGGRTFDGAKDEEPHTAKVAREKRAAGMTIEQIEAGTARDLFDAIAAEMHDIPNRVNQNWATRRKELAALLASGKYSLPGLRLRGAVWQEP